MAMVSPLLKPATGPATKAAPFFEMPMQLVTLVGGSGPSYPFIHDLKLPVATAGLGYPDTRAHAPNENIRIDDYFEGIKFIRELINEFAAE